MADEMVMSEREAIGTLAALVAEIAGRCYQTLGPDRVRSMKAACWDIAVAMEPSLGSDPDDEHDVDVIEENGALALVVNEAVSAADMAVIGRLTPLPSDAEHTRVAVQAALIHVIGIGLIVLKPLDEIKAILDRGVPVR